jgi:hypothetical protein
MPIIISASLASHWHHTPSIIAFLTLLSLRFVADLQKSPPPSTQQQRARDLPLLFTNGAAPQNETPTLAGAGPAGPVSHAVRA